MKSHAVMRTQKSKGERQLMFTDANKHVFNGKLMCRLMKESMLNLVKGTHNHCKEEAPHTNINGKDPINYVLHTKDVEITRFLMQPYSCSVGYHRTIMLDVTKISMVGSYQHSIVYPPYQRFTMQKQGCVAQYMQ